jgi:hypothetical protein
MLPSSCHEIYRSTFHSGDTQRSFVKENVVLAVSSNRIAGISILAEYNKSMRVGQYMELPGDYP